MGPGIEMPGYFQLFRWNKNDNAEVFELPINGSQGKSRYIQIDMESGQQFKIRISRIRKRILYALFFSYFLLYIMLTIFGSYSLKLSSSGELKYDFGLSIPDQREWEPYGVVRERARFNSLGILFMPLIDLDRNCWHKPIKLIQPKTFQNEHWCGSLKKALSV